MIGAESKSRRLVTRDLMSVPPFFIVGCGRSGSSLLRSMLNRHEAIAIPLESLFIIDYLRVSKRIDLAQLKAMLVNEPEIREWGLDITLKDIEGSQTIEQAIELIHELYTRSHGKSFWGQKTPRFVRHTELLHAHFPQARFVHLIRDPRAVVNSLIRSDVHRSNAYHGSHRWRREVDKGLAFTELHSDRATTVHYEDMVQDPETSLRTILQFLGLPFHQEILHHQEQETQEYSSFYSNIHSQLNRSVSTEFVDKWKNQLTTTEIEAVEAICGKLMTRLGYDPMFAQARLPAGYRWLKQADRSLGLVRQALKYLRYRKRYLAHLLWRKWKLGMLKEFIWEVNF